MFDEDRPNNDSDKSMDSHVIENNYVDCSNAGEGTRGCLLMQADDYSTVGARIDNAIVRNNVFFTTDNALTENFIRIRRSVNNAVFYNNTFYNGAEGISVDFHSPQPTNVTIKNNIFDTISGYEVEDGTSNGVSTLNYNLYNGNANLDGCTKGTNAKENKDPKFVSDGSDFSLQSEHLVVRDRERAPITKPLQISVSIQRFNETTDRVRCICNDTEWLKLNIY